ncbi:MAG TPA: polynucleotide adenylyltransferase PcnB [Rubrivivax sp.]|nr:polynucleotide adenylyltransferase PcnB [Burkholderiales bacterium]HNU11138.1 polynucleotide adenylyltransferase PcnB [Rubrivivax sp.]
MIRTFINRLLGKPAGNSSASAAGATIPATAIPLGRRVEVPASEHHIDPTLLDERAVRVVRTLKDAGHEAYIVGGAVRDLLVGVAPKDFDVATDATPEQVKALFRRAFIIGRRFRLVHVVFGRGREHEVVEVSTFRAYLDASSAEQVDGNEKTARHQISDKTHVVDASGRVLRDNVWGEQVEDAARRDFTVNAMYYDPTTQLLVDYHGGLADVRARVLRIIGDPAQRYREDPVRIIRVVRFAAKLGFTLDPATQAPLREMSVLLANVPASRLFDEMLKLLQTGHALRSIEELRRHGLDRGVFPILEAVLHPRQPHPLRERFIELALADTDRRVQEGRAVAPSFMLACLLWHDVQARWAALREAGEPPFPALQHAIDAVFDARIGDVSGRGKLAADMREIWQMQPRFERRTASSAASLVAQPRFRAGYDFLRLRADVGEIDAELADWWEDYQLGDDEEREALVLALRPASAARRAPKPAQSAAGKGKPASKKTVPGAEADTGRTRGEAAAGRPAVAPAAVPTLAGADAAAEIAEIAPTTEGADPAATDEATTKRRRRRRRKPAGQSDQAA